MNANMIAPLAEFSRDHQPAGVRASSRLVAGILTAVLYALFAILFSQRAFWGAPHSAAEIIASLLPEAPRKKIALQPPPFLAHLIRPRAETIAPPAFTVATDAPVAPALLPASAAKSSPLTGGEPAGIGVAGQAVSANGSNGNGTAFAGCFDPVWARAVSDRVGQFFPKFGWVLLKQHRTGVVMVQFGVRRDGRLDMLKIGKTSGDRMLDDAAYNMVRAAQPVPAIPDRMHVDRIDVEIPIDFGTKGIFQASAGNCGPA
jgi:TonB family protein